MYVDGEVSPDSRNSPEKKPTRETTGSKTRDSYPNFPQSPKS